MTLHTDKRPTQAYIDLDALAFNFHSSKNFVGQDIKIMAVVKADGYGHGAAACAVRLDAEGVDWFGVAIPEEGVEIREAGVKCPILCLGSFWPGQEKLLFEYNLTPVIYDLEIAKILSQFAAKLGRRIDVHIKVDTGMGRVGIDHRDAHEFARELIGCKELKVTGLLTHFSSAEDPKENEFTRLQIERFDAASAAFISAGHKPELFDLANSPGAIAHPESRRNLVRLGGALYGLTDDILQRETPQPELKPVLSLKSRIAHLRQVLTGETLGYGRTFETKRDSVIALIPIGYADGYPRGLSNRGKVYINGHIVPVVGRISMDWTLVDVTDIPNVAVGNEIFLIGGGENHAIKASDLARELGTIGYEITCDISPRVPRIFIDSR